MKFEMNDSVNASWVVIVPLGGFIPISGKEAIDEIKLLRVTLFTKEKLFRQRRFPILHHKNFLEKSASKVFENASVFAALRYTGVLSKIKDKALAVITEEINIFGSTRLGTKRQAFNHIGIAGQYEGNFTSHAFLHPTKTNANINKNSIRSGGPFLMHQTWVNYLKKNSFFGDLLKILEGSIAVDLSWKNDLRRAAVLIGKSMNSSDVATAFLFNMIALETLLTRNGDKYSEDLPKRIEAFLGWAGMWKQDAFAEKIDHIYKMRCGIVHAGKIDLISVDDLLFVDDILFNLLNNIIAHIAIFKNKDQIILFANKLAAERLLNLKPKVRPKSLTYLARTYSDDDKGKI